MTTNRSIIRPLLARIADLTLPIATDSDFESLLSDIYDAFPYDSDSPACIALADLVNAIHDTDLNANPTINPDADSCICSADTYNYDCTAH